MNGAEQGFDYLGSLVYNRNGASSSLESAAFGAGRIIKTSTGYEVRYFLTDHLGSVRASVNQAGQVTDRSDYQLLGERWSGSGVEATTNRYQFNGKESQTLLSDANGISNFLDYGARNYNANIGRWFTPDPLSEKYQDLSPYLYCAANPIKYIDPDGMTITESVAAMIAKLNKDLERRKEDNKNEIARKEERKKNVGMSQSSIKYLQQKIDNLTSENQNLDRMMGTINDEVNQLKSSTQLYDLKIDGSQYNDGRPWGKLSFEESNNSVVINLPNSDDLSIFAHEFKHAHQFENGELSIEGRPNGAPLYDFSDESEAYARGEWFGVPVSNWQPFYNNLQRGPVSATNHPNLGGIIQMGGGTKAIQKVSNTTQSIFRIGSITYHY